MARAVPPAPPPAASSAARLDLIADRPRPAAGPGRYARTSRTPAAPAPAELRAAAARCGASVAAFAHAALIAVLARYTGQEEIAVAARVAGGTAMIRVAPADPVFADLVGECGKELRDAAVGTWPDPEPLSVAVYDHGDAGPDDARYDDARYGDGAQAEDIAVRLTVAGEVLEAEVRYAADLYADGRMAALLRHWERVLTAAVRDPEARLSRLPILDAAEHAALLAAGQGPDRPAPHATLHRLVGDRTAEAPDAVAAVCAGVTMTYRELDERSAALARRLRAHGVGPGSVVAAVLDRGLHTLVAMLGVHRAGAAYAPVDPAFPPARIAFVLRDTAAPIVLATADSAAALPTGGDADEVDISDLNVRTLLLDADARSITGGARPGSGCPEQLPTDQPPTDAPLPEVAPDALAYVLFTSGSTGTPKGVQLDHAAMVTYVSWMTAECAVGPDSRVLHACSPVFDLSVGEIFSALTSGARSVIATRADVLDRGALTALIAREQVTHTFTPPTLLGLVEPAPGDVGRPTPLRHVLTCGEVLAPELAARWLGTGARVLNLYGPAEAAVACTVHECAPEPAGRPVPIGVAMPNRIVRVLDRYGDPAPVGAVGDLIVGGAGVARGYLNRPELTAQRFIPDPFGPAPAYRTGDLARWNPDGVLEFLGRADTQVKLDGMRIELGEIETVLAGHPAIAAAAVTLRTDEGRPRLVAYVIARAEPADPAALRAHAAGALPGYMVPAAIVALEAFPLGATGKVDRKALPAPSDVRPGPDAGRAPASPTERALAAAWSAVLGIGSIGADEGFFDLGGSSLGAARVCALLGETGSGFALPVSQLYRTPTIAGLAAWLDADRRTETQGHDGESGCDQGIAMQDPQPPADAVAIGGAAEAEFTVTALAPGQANLVEATARLVCPLTWWIGGDLDTAALRAALTDVHRRHQALHAHYLPTRPATARVPREPAPPEVCGLAEAPDDATALDRLDEAVQRPLAIGDGLVWRAVLVPSRESRRTLFGIGVHHVAFDGSSESAIITDLVHAYTARRAGDQPVWGRPAPTLAALAAQAARAAAAVDLEPQRAYWIDQLRTVPRQALPGLRRGPLADWGPKDGHLAALPGSALPAWDEAARALGTTRFGWLAAVFGRVLAETTGQVDVAMTAPVARRGDAATDRGVGCRLDAVCLRLRPHGRTAADWLREAATVVGAAMRAQDLSFGEVVGALARIRPDLHILQTIPTFLLQDHPRPPLALPGAPALDVRDPIAKEVPTPLTVEVLIGAEGDPGGLTVRVTVRTDLVEPGLARRIGARFRELVVAGPDA